MEHYPIQLYGRVLPATDRHPISHVIINRYSSRVLHVESNRGIPEITILAISSVVLAVLAVLAALRRHQSNTTTR